MPWTFAHPAILRPLSVRLAPIYLYAAALGSLMPDVGYYLGDWGRELSGHSFGGLFQVCLPFSWLFLLLSFLLATPMLQVLPAPHRRFLLHLWGQITAAWRWAPAQLVALSVCMLLGSITHLIWDSGTHRGGSIVLALGLDYPVLDVPVFRWLQHLSTIFGTAVLVFWYRQGLAKFVTKSPQKAESKGMLMVLLVLLLIAVFASLWAWQIVQTLAPALQLRAFFFQAAILAAQLGLACWLALALVLALYSRSVLSRLRP